MAQLTGKFVGMLPAVEGEKNGKPWIRVQFAVMTLETNSRLVAFDAFGQEKVDIVRGLTSGQTLIIDYAPESREFNGRYYTNLNMIRMQVAVKMQQQPVPPQPQTNAQVTVTNFAMPDAGNAEMFGKGGAQ